MFFLRRSGGQTYIKKLLWNLEDTSVQVYLLALASLSLNGTPDNE